MVLVSTFYVTDGSGSGPPAWLWGVRGPPRRGSRSCDTARGQLCPPSYVDETLSCERADAMAELDGWL